MTPSLVTDVCIVGSGPAGLQAGYLLHKKGIDFTILEKAPHVSSFLRRYPRHREFISVNKVNTGLSDPDTNLRHDWNSLINDEGLLFGNYSRAYFPKADDFTRYAEDFAAPFKDRIRFNCDIVEIAKPGDMFEIRCNNGRLMQAKQVIIATGVSQAYTPDIEGLELAENYTEFDPDPERYLNKRVLILGKGNSAFETADALTAHAASIHVMSPNPIKFAWQTHFVGHLRAVNNNFLDTYQLKSQNAVLDAAPLRIEKTDDGLVVHAQMQAAEGHEITLAYDHIIACTGFRFDPRILAPALRPNMLHFGKFPEMTAEWEHPSARGLFFAGTIMQSRDFKQTMSGFIHGFRHNVACLTDLIAERLGRAPFPQQQTPLDHAALRELIITRISTASGIFLQPGFLCDLIELSGAEQGRHLRDIPAAWSDHGGTYAAGDKLRITLEYGDFGGDSLHVKRENNMFGKTPDAFIHPVIRHLRDGEVIDEMHLADHLDADWRAPAARDKGAQTVLAMTFRDAGGAVPPYKIARSQLDKFLTRCFDGRAANAAE
ncbi:MAG: NAD(P)-binding domain-containing protein [Sulfitobacter sp.]